MKKRFLAIVLASAMVLGALAGCGKSNNEEATTEAEYDDGFVDVKIDNPEKYVKLGDYKNITIEGAKAEVTDEDVAARLEEEAYEYSTYDKIDRDTVQEEDIVNVSFVCSVGDEVIDDINYSDFDVTLGNGEIDYFSDISVDEALVGAKVGTTQTLEGTFSEDLYSDTASGKKGTMEITVNYISEENIPVIDDEFVKTNMAYESLDEYKKVVREELQSEAESYASDDNENMVLRAAIDGSELIADFPEDIVATERANSILEATQMAYYYGMEIGDTEEDLNKFFEENAGMSLDDYVIDNLKAICVRELILKAENVEITDEEIDQMVQTEMESGGYQSKEEVLESIGRDEFEEELKQSKVIDILMATATIK